MLKKEVSAAASDKKIAQCAQQCDLSATALSDCYAKMPSPQGLVFSYGMLPAHRTRNTAVELAEVIHNAMLADCDKQQPSRRLC